MSYRTCEFAPTHKGVNPLGTKQFQWEYYSSCFYNWGGSQHQPPVHTVLHLDGMLIKTAKAGTEIGGAQKVGRSIATGNSRQSSCQRPISRPFSHALPSSIRGERLMAAINDKPPRKTKDAAALVRRITVAVSSLLNRMLINWVDGAVSLATAKSICRSRTMFRYSRLPCLAGHNNISHASWLNGTATHLSVWYPRGPDQLKCGRSLCRFSDERPLSKIRHFLVLLLSCR